MAKILISTSSFGKDDITPLEYCRQGNEVILNPFGRKLTSDELIELASEVDGIIAGTEYIDKTVLEKLPKLKVISRCGVGMDNIDLDTAAELGVKVYNTADAPTLAVAELTVGLMLALLRRITLSDHGLRNSIWNKHMGSLLSGKNVGIIGFGRIGKKVAELLLPFRVNIAYYDIAPQDVKFPCQLRPLEELLSWADIITLHCSTSHGAKTIIGKEELKQMKKGAYLINTSRGGLVDEEALYLSLKEGHLSAAALDVYEKEPYTGPLRELENIILTPHVGSYAKESRIEMEMQAVRNLLEGLKNK